MLVLIFSPHGELSEKNQDVPPHIIIIVIDDLGETWELEVNIITKFLPDRLERCIMEQPGVPSNSSRRACQVEGRAGENK